MLPGQRLRRAMSYSAIIIIAVSQTYFCLPVSSRHMLLANRNGSNPMENGWVSLHGWMGNHYEGINAISSLGSRPPRCENKCGACRPCEATQVPTTAEKERLQYANYEPEGWKCKCGASFFNP